MAREVTRHTIPATASSLWQDDFNQMVRQFFGDSEASLAGAFSPALDVEENEDGFTLHVELPGIAPEQVDVSIEDSVLTIAGQREFYADANAEGFKRIERRFGRFHRAVRLPDRVNADGIEATYKDGLLTIAVPKAEEAKPRRIQISAS
ncbi:Hsp20/alpha crystallin family protein [Demequina activiva]|uniref:Heat-shock protein n=1 Tax=Demequina activiva TaxID=1582364 RepID=A0A919Q5I8_9MICO|nr:Hsp20/alpha crystallin family protein [Demequina activiva]GIG55266.1 heat-shock protein [Demequina activiva]